MTQDEQNDAVTRLEKSLEYISGFYPGMNNAVDMSEGESLRQAADRADAKELWLKETKAFIERHRVGETV